MSAKTMAEVILRSTLLDLQDSLFLAKELEAAGFGLVADAKAEAWDRGMGDMAALMKAGPGYEIGNPYRKRRP